MRGVWEGEGERSARDRAGKVGRPSSQTALTLDLILQNV